VRSVIRRAALVFTLGLALAVCALPQESKSASGNQAAESEPSMGWDIANFVILVIVLGYLIKKSVPPLFRKQSDEIQAALAEAAKVKHEAAAFAAGIEMRLANLQREIENLRETAHAEMSAEGERIRQETAHHLDRIREQSSQEIALMTRGAKDELRKYAAGLAVRLAQERIRSRMNPALQDKLVSGFLADLDRRAGSRTAAN
jgi:F-type H+-transporting ATPase subunit b